MKNRMKVDESCPVTVFQKRRMCPDVLVGIASTVAIACYVFITYAGCI